LTGMPFTGTQRALADYTPHSLLRSLNGARRFSHLTLDSQAWQRGVKSRKVVIPA